MTRDKMLGHLKRLSTDLHFYFEPGECDQMEAIDQAISILDQVQPWEYSRCIDNLCKDHPNDPWKER